jgi:hypothetical protein
MRRVKTYNDVLEALGGPAGVGIICDQNPNAACTWRATRGKFPAKYYFVMVGALKRRGYEAPRYLWGFHSKAKPPKKPKPPKQASAAA